MTSKTAGEKSEPIMLEEIHSTVALFRKLSEAGQEIPTRLHTKRESLNVVMRQVLACHLLHYCYKMHYYTCIGIVITTCITLQCYYTHTWPQAFGFRYSHSITAL
jgi:hypothetical protein